MGFAVTLPAAAAYGISDLETEAVNDSKVNDTADVAAWTDTDISADLPTGATHAILNIQCAAYYDGPLEECVYAVGVRKNGSTGADDAHWCRVWVPDGFSGWVTVAVTAIIEVDGSGVFEHMADKESGEDPSAVNWHIDVRGGFKLV